MTRRRIALWGTTALVAVLIGAGLFGRQIWLDTLQTAGIEQLDWQGVDLSLDNLNLGQLRVVRAQPGQRMSVTAQAVRLTWSWGWQGLTVQSLTVGNLDLELQPETGDPATPANASNPAVPDRIPAWLPPHLTVSQFSAGLPCASGRCRLSGSLTANRPGSSLPLALVLQLDHDDHHLQVQAELSGTLPDDLTFTAELAVDGRQTLTAQTHVQHKAGHPRLHWSGQVTLPELPRTDWLLAWLQQWQPLSLDDLPAHPQTARLSAHWQLQGPADDRFMSLLTGNLTVSGHLPQAWPIPGIATVKGDLELALKTDQGRWQADTAQADVVVTNPGPWIAPVPASLRPAKVTVHVRPGPPSAQPGKLALQVRVTGDRPSSLNLAGGVVVATSAPWSVQLNQFRVQASLADIAVSGTTLKGVKADATLTGHLDARSLELGFAKGSSLGAARLTVGTDDSGLSIDNLTADVAKLSLNAGYDPERGSLQRLQVQGPIELAAKTVRHRALKPQAWRFRGVLKAGLDALATDGQLSAQAGSAVDLSVNDRFARGVNATAKLALAGEAGAQALAGTLSAWPAVLTVSGGKLGADAQLHWPSAGEPDLNVRLNLTDLTGVYDRTAWSGLNGDVALSIHGDRLAVPRARLTLAGVNPGIPVGPVTLDGQYRSPLASPGRGELSLDLATADLLGGRVRLVPGHFNLGQLPIRMPLKLTDVDLSKLMALYPADNLAGTGILSGEVPLILGPPDGIRIEAGRISARQPGGTLTLPADRLRSIGQGNQALDLVAKAMENFHYDTLSSTVAYDKDGTLSLGLHLEGNNPEVESGRPIVLNINLEEDIPALLTSLQLSGRVNDAVTERVRKLMQQRKNATGQ